jgi:hypothetical protein
MKAQRPNSPDYLVTITGIREVSLVGSADASYWRERLAKEGLFPYPGGEGVEIRLGAAAIRWKGFDSLEFTLSVAVSEREEGGELGFFLLQAFNSSPGFTWIERTFFQTPYALGGIRLSERLPANLGVYIHKEWFVSAHMSPQGHAVHSADEGWEGSIHLPGDRILGTRRRLAARFSGRTASYPFLNGLDNLWINPSSQRKVFNWLLDSHFCPLEWKIRQDALHARSVTVQSWKK